MKPVLELIVSDFQRDKRSGGRLVYHADAGAQLKRNADIDALGIVMRNLIENALVHGEESQRIEIQLNREGVISIVNGGPAIDHFDAEDLKKRFRRGRTNASGSGLGLAISDRIVTQMGGRLELYSPAPGRSDGFEARLVLPV